MVVDDSQCIIKEKSSNRINVFFTILIVVYPILSVYWSGISSLSIADVLLLLFTIKLIIDIFVKRKIKMSKTWIVLLIYLSLHILLIAISTYQSIEIFTFFRYAIYIFSIAIYIPNYFIYSKGIKYLKIVGGTVAVFSIVQAIGIYAFGFYIKGYISFLPVMREELAGYGENYVSGVLRVRGFFGEPSHLAAYMSIVLVVFLFTDSKNKYFWAVISSVALIFSVSTTAYILLVFIWLFYFFILIRKSRTLSKTKSYSLILLLIVITLILILFLKSNIYTSFYNRLSLGSTYTGRMDSYEIFRNNDFPVFFRIFGHGYLDYTSYLASYPMIFWRFGYVGMVVYLYVFIKGFINNKTIVQNTILIVFILLCSGTLTLFSYSIMTYMALVFSYDNDYILEDKNE